MCPLRRDRSRSVPALTEEEDGQNNSVGRRQEARTRTAVAQRRRAACRRAHCQGVRVERQRRARPQHREEDGALERPVRHDLQRAGKSDVRKEGMWNTRQNQRTVAARRRTRAQAAARRAPGGRCAAAPRASLVGPPAVCEASGTGIAEDCGCSTVDVPETGGSLAGFSSAAGASGGGGAGPLAEASGGTTATLVSSPSCSAGSPIDTISSEGRRLRMAAGPTRP